jgi:lysophospholipase L1-like esterase
MARFVALGDSLTEGVGDAHAGYPNGWRGWADLLAEHLARLDPTIEYANLALRAKRARHVLDEQVGDAVAMDPSIVSLWAGGNDILLPRGSVAEVAGAVDESVDRLAATGAAVLLFTGFELADSVLLRHARRRVALLGAAIESIARNHDAIVIDVSTFASWSGRPLVAPDRVHPTTLGHHLLARRVCDVLGLPPLWVEDECMRPQVPGRWARWRDEHEWWWDTVLPQLHRWATKASVKEAALPKWSELVRPATWTMGAALASGS